jgi:hypothetical protein
MRLDAAATAEPRGGVGRTVSGARRQQRIGAEAEGADRRVGSGD